MKKVIFVFLLILIGVSTSAKAQILAELFRDVGCKNCPEPDSAFEQFVNAHPEYKVIPVYFHNGYTTPNDPFYQACKADVDYRDGATHGGMYNFDSDPWGMINGSKPFPDAQHAANWISDIKSDPAPISTVMITDSMQVNGKMLIHMHVESSSTGQVVKPYVLLVESNLYYDNPYGYGKVPNNLWNNIFRGMVPAKDGGAQFSLSGTNDFTYTVDTTGKGWNLSNMKVVGVVQDAFAQSDGISYLIYGIGQTQVTFKAGVNDSPVYSSSLLPVNPNPSYHSANIPFTLSQSSVVNITVTDALGRTVATIANGMYQEGNNSVAFTPTEHLSGVYFVTMTVDGVYVGSEKIIFE